MPFPPLAESDVEATVALGGALRLKSFLTTVAATGLVCAWGDDESMACLENTDGEVVLSLWPHPVYAEREMRSTAGPGEGPLELELPRFLEVTLPSLEEEGCGLAIFPVEDRIAISLSPDRFRSKVAAALRGR